MSLSSVQYPTVLSHHIKFTPCQAAQSCHASSSFVKQKRLEVYISAFCLERFLCYSTYLLFSENPNLTGSKRWPLIIACFPHVFSRAALLHVSGLCWAAFLMLLRPESSKGFLWCSSPCEAWCVHEVHEKSWSSGLVWRRASMLSQSNRLWLKSVPHCLLNFF